MESRGLGRRERAKESGGSQTLGGVSLMGFWRLKVRVGDPVFSVLKMIASVDGLHVLC